MGTFFYKGKENILDADRSGRSMPMLLSLPLHLTLYYNVIYWEVVFVSMVQTFSE